MLTEVMAVIQPETQCAGKDGIQSAFLAALVLTYLLYKFLSLMLPHVTRWYLATFSSLLLHAINSLQSTLPTSKIIYSMYIKSSAQDAVQMIII